MRIAYLTNILIDATDSGGSVHATQIIKRLINKKHIIYTNLKNKSNNFVKWGVEDFFGNEKKIDIFYVRIDGYEGNDELTLLKKSNPFVPCIWEINAPLEELRTYGISERKLQKLNKRRKKLAKMVDMAICVSCEIEQYAKNELGVKKTFVIHNGSDPELFTPEKKDNNIYDRTKYKVLWAGSPKYKWQGFRKVQKLSKILKEKGMNDILIIVTAVGKSSENIIYIGHIPYSEMPRYMASADVGLCIYEDIDFYEQFYFSPLKLYDYMASGLPVIGSDVGQIKFVVEENQNGLLTDNSVEDLIEKILFLKNNPDKASEMGYKGRKAVIEKYNWDNVVLQTESILLDAIEKHKMLMNSLPKWRLAISNFNSKVGRTLRHYYSSSRHILSKAKSTLILC
ncbi:MAG: glycosyltransferase family protein [Thermodesulfovibrionales bacterium]